MSGFQFTPTGIVPMVVTTASNEVVEAAPLLPPPAPRAPATVVETPLLGKSVNVIKLARARLKDLNREIKRLHALEQERDELRRLLAAAKNKSLAVVRDIKAAKRG